MASVQTAPFRHMVARTAVKVGVEKRLGPNAMGIIGLMAVGLAARAWILVMAGQFSSDEAVPGLMARHILQEHELPVFFWGQDYFGSAEAYLIAAVMAIAQNWAWVVFVPSTLASLALVALTALLADDLWGAPAGLLAAIPVALPPPVLARELLSSAGGFALGFALMLGSLVCLLKAVDHTCSTRWIALAALCAGFGMWIWQPALVALAPLLLLVLLRMRRWHPVRELMLGIAPLGIGLMPALAYNVQRGWPTLSAMLIKSSDTPLAGDTPLARLQSLGRLAITALGGGDDSLGGTSTLLAVLLGAGLVIGVVVLAISRKWWKLGLLTAFVVLHTAAAYEVTRYFVPLVLAACALFGVVMVRLFGARRMSVVAALIVVGGLNLIGYPAAVPLVGAEGLSSVADTQAALDALQQRGLTRGYADYWAAYPITYLSAEQVIVAPRLPFVWRARTDRYPAYTRLVDGVEDPQHVFVLVDRRCSAEPYSGALDAAGAAYQVDDVSRWQLLWNIRAQPGAEQSTLDALREAIADATC